MSRTRPGDAEGVAAAAAARAPSPAPVSSTAAGAAAVAPTPAPSAAASSLADGSHASPLPTQSIAAAGELKPADDGSGLGGSFSGDDDLGGAGLEPVKVSWDDGGLTYYLKSENIKNRYSKLLKQEDVIAPDAVNEVEAVRNARNQYQTTLFTLARHTELGFHIQESVKKMRKQLEKLETEAEQSRVNLVVKICKADKSLQRPLEKEQKARKDRQQAAKIAMDFESDKPAFNKGGALGIIGGIGYGFWTLPPVDPAAAAEAGKGILEFLGAYSPQILYVVSATVIGLLIGLALASLYVWGRHSHPAGLSGVGSAVVDSHPIPPAPSSRSLA